METVYKSTILDLYKALYKVFTDEHTLFICKAIQINRANLTSLQKVKLRDHFYTQFPSETQYTEFYNNPLFNKHSLSFDGEWFKYERIVPKTISIFDMLIKTESFTLRVKLLEAIIENLEKNPELNLVL